MARRASQKMSPELDSERRVPVFLLHGFWDELEKRGWQLQKLERLSGVSRPRRGDYASTILAADMHRLFEVCQSLAGDERIGLRAGRAIGVSGFHLIGHLALASATLPQAVEHITRVQPQLGQRRTCVEELEGGELRLGIMNRDVSDRPGARIEAELAGVVMHDVVLHFFADGALARPVVEFPFEAPVDTRPYHHMFPGGVRFGGEGTFVYCARSALAPRRSGADPGLLEHLLELALTHYGAANTEENWTRRVRSALQAQPAPRLIDAAALAEQLGVSVRGLSRRLAREGVSLTGLLDEALYERAQVLLRRPGTTAAQVAEALGYAELSSFFRAFRRWSGGLTPSAYRRHHVGPRVA